MSIDRAGVVENVAQSGYATAAPLNSPILNKGTAFSHEERDRRDVLRHSHRRTVTTSASTRDNRLRMATRLAGTSSTTKMRGRSTSPGHQSTQSIQPYPIGT